MTTSGRAEGFSPELRASLFHFTVFAATGVGAAYYAIWMSGKGLSPEQIGIVNAVPVLIMLAVNIFIGRLADRASDWKSTIVVLSLIAGVVPVGYFFAGDFWTVLLVFTACTVPSGALVPVIDAATLRMTKRRGTDFGFVRAVGEAFVTVYPAIVARRKDLPFDDAAREKLFYKRGRYVEFNLVYDRGTRFGFGTDADPEAYLMSLPPIVKW